MEEKSRVFGPAKLPEQGPCHIVAFFISSSSTQPCQWGGSLMGRRLVGLLADAVELVSLLLSERNMCLEETY